MNLIYSLDFGLKFSPLTGVLFQKTMFFYIVINWLLDQLFFKINIKYNKQQKQNTYYFTASSKLQLPRRPLLKHIGKG